MLARTGMWSPRGTETTVLTCPCAVAFNKGDTPVVKTDNIQWNGRHAHLGQDRRLPGVVTQPRPWRCLPRSRSSDLRWGSFARTVRKAKASSLHSNDREEKLTTRMPT